MLKQHIPDVEAFTQSVPTEEVRGHALVDLNLLFLMDQKYLYTLTTAVTAPRGLQYVWCILFSITTERMLQSKDCTLYMAG